MSLIFCASTALAEGPVPELPITADYCAILRAFTTKSDPRCQAPNPGRLRSSSQKSRNFPTAAASLSETQGQNGYFIRFAFNSVELTNDYKAHLDRLTAVFQSTAMEGVCVKLVGHTDSVGSAAYNRHLSMARAKMVEAYLRGKSVLNPSRLRSEGAGEARPLQNLPGGHPLNRRVEILARAQTQKGCL